MSESRELELTNAGPRGKMPLAMGMGLASWVIRNTESYCIEMPLREFNNHGPKRKRGKGNKYHD